MSPPLEARPPDPSGEDAGGTGGTFLCDLYQPLKRQKRPWQGGVSLKTMKLKTAAGPTASVSEDPWDVNGFATEEITCRTVPEGLTRNDPPQLRPAGQNADPKAKTGTCSSVN
jgi:hypothetical protein